MLRRHLQELGRTGLKFVAQFPKCLNFNKPCNLKVTLEVFCANLNPNLLERDGGRVVTKPSTSSETLAMDVRKSE